MSADGERREIALSERSDSASHIRGAVHFQASLFWSTSFFFTALRCVSGAESKLTGCISVTACFIFLAWQLAIPSSLILNIVKLRPRKLTRSPTLNGQNISERITTFPCEI
jgi:hypothetical protein